MKKLLVLFLLLTWGLAAGETRVHGIIDKDTEWNPEDGPYIVTGDIWIQTGALLRIESGTQVRVMKEEKDRHPKIPQIDRNDSQMVSIKVDGGMSCLGEWKRRIEFKPHEKEKAAGVSWYGIVCRKAIDEYTLVGNTEISGAIYGLRIEKCGPEIYNTIFSYNNVGILCGQNATPLIRNCTFVSNMVSGIRVNRANPHITCNIIANNRNHGIWGDGVSRMTVRYNCIFGNRDGNLMDCPVNIGRLTRLNAKKDSCDKFYNIFLDPVFAGSPSDSAAVEKDVTLQTDASRVNDTALVKIQGKELKDKQAATVRKKQTPNYYLSRYSPCINAGNPKKKFRDVDGSVNDMGCYGGPLTRTR